MAMQKTESSFTWFKAIQRQQQKSENCWLLECRLRPLQSSGIVHPFCAKMYVLKPLFRQPIFCSNNKLVDVVLTALKLKRVRCNNNTPGKLCSSQLNIQKFCRYIILLHAIVHRFSAYVRYPEHLEKQLLHKRPLVMRSCM